MLRSVASDGRRSWGPYQLLVPVGSPARGALNQPCPPDRRNPGTAWNNWTASGEASALGLLPLLHASYYCIAVTARGPGPALALVTVPRRGRGRGRSERSGPAPGRSGGGVPAIPALTRPLRPGPRGWGCGEGGRRGTRTLAFWLGGHESHWPWGQEASRCPGLNFGDLPQRPAPP